ncbi:hypothetical protein SDC9_144599 [bioreactor metagenome]|uniref:Uncharacterized protein n=1 Tax=bioreactor metagenome TaxID=1076179 RepID=A0A645E771_9ZZZZ
MGEKFQQTLFREIVEIEQIDDRHIVLLAVAMTTTDSLLNALWVPRQVVIDHQ